MSLAARTWILVAVAGAAGTLFRYALGGWLARSTGETFPWETLMINLLGCVGIGGIAGLVDRGSLLSPATRMALMAGFLGGFTTFSSFALETFRLATDGEWAAAAAYVGLTNLSGLVGVWGAYRLVASL
jgi:CrcB protein